MALEAHGHTLPQLVVRTVKASGTGWKFQTWEHPVSHNGLETRIDCILRYGNSRLFLAIECKRVAPDFTDAWAFFSAKHIGAQLDALQDTFIGEIVSVDKSGSPRVPGGVVGLRGDYASLGLVVPRNIDKATGRNDENIAIENAAYQVCKGAIGLVDHFSRMARVGHSNAAGIRTVVPMIVTTAPLLYVTCDLSDVDPRTGKLKTPSVSRPVKWLFYHYHTSMSLAADHVRENTGEGELPRVLVGAHVRTIPVVQAEHLEEFLRFFTTESVNLTPLNECF